MANTFFSPCLLVFTCVLYTWFICQGDGGGGGVGEKQNRVQNKNVKIAK